MYSHTMNSDSIRAETLWARERNGFVQQRTRALAQSGNRAGPQRKSTCSCRVAIAFVRDSTVAGCVASAATAATALAIFHERRWLAPLLE